jgi:Tfp pilus assembly protein PilO
MFKSFKTKLAVSIGINLIAIIVLILVIFYLNKNIIASSEEINRMRVDFLSRSRAIASLSELKKDAEQARIYSDVLNSSLPTTEDLPEFNTEVFNLEKKHNLPSSFKFSGSEIAPKAGTPGEIAFDLNLDGVYDDIVNFLKDLEYSSYVTDIQNFDLVGGGTDNTYRAFFRGIVLFH